MLFIISFLLSSQVVVTASTLQLALAALLFLLVAHGGQRLTSRTIHLSVVQGLALLAHNSSIVFIPGIVLIMLIDRSRRVSARVIRSVLFMVISLAPWIILRLSMGQTSVHSPGWGSGQYSLSEYIAQMMNGLGAFFLPERLEGAFLPPVACAILLFFLWTVKPGRYNVKRITMPSGRDTWGAAGTTAVLAGVSLLCLPGLFNATWIHNRLDGRFLWFGPMALVPLATAFCATRRRIALAFCGVLLIALPLARSSQHVAGGFIRTPRPESGPRHQSIIYPVYCITRGGGCSSGEGLFRVRPPTFPWQERYKGTGEVYGTTGEN